MAEEIPLCAYKLTLSLPKSAYHNARRALFENGLSVQEFVAYVCRLIERNDVHAMAILKEAKAFHVAQGNAIGTVPTSATAIYNMLESMVEETSQVKQ